MEWAEYRRNGNRSDGPGRGRLGLLQRGRRRRGLHRQIGVHPGVARLDKVQVEHRLTYML